MTAPEIRHFGNREEEGAAAALFTYVSDYFCCANSETEEGFSRRLYKDTACGAWFKFTEAGFAIGTIVEGSDATLEYHFVYTPDFDLDDTEEAQRIHEWLDHHIDQLEEFAEWEFEHTIDPLDDTDEEIEC